MATVNDSWGNPRDTLPRITTASYVYPVKSLLSGRIQPAAAISEPPSENLDNNLPTKALLASTSPTASSRSSKSIDAACRSSKAENGDTVWAAPASPGSLSSAKSERKASSARHPNRSLRLSRSSSPNFRHFPAEGSPALPRSFSSQLLTQQQSPLKGYPGKSEMYNIDLGGDASPNRPCSNSPITPKASPSSELPFNPSEYGLVHLPPLVAPRSPQELHSERAMSDDIPIVASPLAINLRRESTGSSASSETHVNVRFEHAQDENGNHVIVGREGVLQKCEDEPIRTPGSVQAFGVLIAVQETEDALIVRQVSENSTELLGLSPRYLFSLECFTDTLPESQADILWDKIEYLGDLGNEDDGGPQVFLLSGWGAPGTGTESLDNRCSWTCWCAIHRPTVSADPSSSTSDLIIMEFEWERDTLNPLFPPVSVAQGASSSPPSVIPSTEGSVDVGLHLGKPQPIDDSSGAPHPKSSDAGLEGEAGWVPSIEDILESTTSYSKPLPALERLRRSKYPMPWTESTSSPLRRRSTRRARENSGNSCMGVGMMDVFAVMRQMNEQLGAVDSLQTYLKVMVGVLKELTQFHRVMVYQFDESWNGQVVAELVDWSQTKDLYRGLHFPASDIPAQARDLYAINKVRILYDRLQPTARIVVRSKEDLEVPLNMTHCYLRAMSPIHIKYLANMGVRASMSISIMSFGKLWGLITCHSYGSRGMRVSFAIRQMLRLLSQTISRNIERLSYAERLHTRKLMNTAVSDRHPSGYIVSNADDLLGLFDADFGILVIGEGAKILGPNQHGQEILIMSEYLRLKKFSSIQASQAVTEDFPDLQASTGFQTIAGLLLVPLSSQGTDFIAFLRKGQPREVRWAGKPYKEGREAGASLEPRKSFKIWSEIVAGRSRPWTDEQLETAGVLALVYGKFIEVWRQKESALQTTKLTEILLSNASHEVRTPLNHIINYLEMALNGPLEKDARENLSRSHTASKSLLFTINDLLDLTRLESGKETSFNEPFDLPETIKKATHLYRKEAERRHVDFQLDLDESPRMVVGDATKIRTVVQNLTANSLKYTTKGSITVSCTPFCEPEGLRSPQQTAVEIVVADTGAGIPSGKLEYIFREFEHVESSEPTVAGDSGVGLGLAVVARIVEQLGGQLRVDSKLGDGSRFSFLIPLALSAEPPPPGSFSSGTADSTSPLIHSHRKGSGNSKEFDSFLGTPAPSASVNGSRFSLNEAPPPPEYTSRSLESIENVEEALRLVKAVKVDTFTSEVNTMARTHPKSKLGAQAALPTVQHLPLRILIVEDNDINRKILAKRLVLDGHTVVNTTNGQEGLDKVRSDRAFDAILMDIQMPIINGFDATRKIREFEESSEKPTPMRLSQQLNGRIPIFAVSASLHEKQRGELLGLGIDGWILKPIDFHRLSDILKGVTDHNQRCRDLYHPEGSWEAGGWLRE